MGILGDSKSGYNPTYDSIYWPGQLFSALNDADNPDKEWSENWPRDTWAQGSATVNTIKSSIDANILLHEDSVYIDGHIFLINLGANDGPTTVEATWKADYQYIIDALLVKWPDAKIYLAKPWSRGCDVWRDTQAGWIDDIIALYSGNVLVGHDERVWMKGADNGDTMTVDGVHYSTAGHEECKNQWYAILHP